METMDVRPLVQFYRNKPDSYDDGSGHSTINQKLQTHQQAAGIEELHGHCNGYFKPTWGDPYRALELWMEISSLIDRMPKLERELLDNYLLEIKTSCDSENWESWPKPCLKLEKALKVIVWCIM